MKKLGKGKGQKVHPVPPPRREHLEALPDAVLALATVLSAEEQEVLVYLLSCSGTEKWREWPRRRVHPPELGFRCFGCYTNFWARWHASPNRHVIHRIIDAVEESLEGIERAGGSRGLRRRRCGRGGRKGADLRADAAAAAAAEAGFGAGVKELLALDHGDDDAISSIDGDDEETEDMSNLSKSSAGRLMSFIGQTVWGVWN